MRTAIFSLILLAMSALAVAQEDFYKYFACNAMYLQYNVAIRHDSLVAVGTPTPFVYGSWSGPLAALKECDTTARASRRVLIYGKDGGEPIYCHYYSTLIDEAIELGDTISLERNISREMLCLPMPRREALVCVQRRNSTGDYSTFMEYRVPRRHKFRRLDVIDYDTRNLWTSGPPAESVDITILPQGYYGKWDAYDSICNLFAERLLDCEPFRSNRHRINIRQVYAMEPRYDLARQNYRFGIFGINRYVGTLYQMCTMAQAAIVPSDCVVVFLNSADYGGGGIYNHYAVFSSHHPLSIEGMIHEFGHSFANLEDEYEGDVFSSKEQPESHCIMRTLSEHQFCEKCQEKILQSIKYWNKKSKTASRK